MTAQDIIDAIHGSYHTGSKNGFKNIQALLDALQYEGRSPLIHVAGTNGKGSTCAMLNSILREAGLKTGMYTSPFLQHYQERIRINSIPLVDDILIRNGERLVKVMGEMEAEGIRSTPFELGTALALTTFETEKVDIGIVQVGLGGRLDPTNIIQPNVCAITAIGMDHMEFLGNTLQEIAAEKAGIMKKNVPCVVQNCPDSLKEIFISHALQNGAPLKVLQDSNIANVQMDMYGTIADLHLEHEYIGVRINLPGEHQVHNALTAVAVIEVLRHQGFVIPDEAVYRGLEHVVWPARLEWCGNILLDGAHNAHGVTALAEYVQKNLNDKKRVLLTGVLKDKLGTDMLGKLASIADEVVTVTPDNPRAMTAQQLAEKLNAIGHKAIAADSVAKGIEISKMCAGENGIVIAAGSLYLMGLMRDELGLKWN